MFYHVTRAAGLSAPGMAPASPPRLYSILNHHIPSIAQFHIRGRCARVQRRCYPLILRDCRPELREARLARHPDPPLQAFCAYKKVADSGDVVIEKRDFAIVCTRVPAIATTAIATSRYCRNRISPVGHHHGARRLVSPCLHDEVESVIICGAMFHNERHTSISHCSLLPSPTTIICC
jgi:hypothetical protein